MNTNSLQTSNISKLATNMTELNSISDKVLNEMKYKNNVLENGLGDCEECKRYMRVNNVNNRSDFTRSANRSLSAVKSANSRNK